MFYQLKSAIILIFFTFLLILHVTRHRVYKYKERNEKSKRISYKPFVPRMSLSFMNKPLCVNTEHILCYLQSESILMAICKHFFLFHS